MVLAGAYAVYLPDAREPPRQAVQCMLMWSFKVLASLLTQHQKVGVMNKEALLDHKEQRRLHRLAAKMTDDDYEHAGPAEKTEDKDKHAHFQRQVAQNTLNYFKTEMGAYPLSRRACWN